MSQLLFHYYLHAYIQLSVFYYNVGKIEKQYKKQKTGIWMEGDSDNKLHRKDLYKTTEIPERFLKKYAIFQ